MLGLTLAESGHLPDRLIRLGIRSLLRQRLKELGPEDPDRLEALRSRFREECRTAPIAPVPDLANEQHYEVSADFFQQVLGPRLKYSSGLWTPEIRDLAASEEAMLALSCERAGLEDGMRVLDLGCGWGSLSLWIAEHFPNARVLAVSNSKTQREFILGRCAQRGLDRVEVVTADINHFDPGARFDRVMSVEMFEHVRNHEQLLGRIAGWLTPEGRLFVHHFAHRCWAYPFEDQGPSDWMGRHFFSGGMMPAHDHLLHCQRDLAVEEHWQVDGTHYQKTCDAWLAQQDARAAALAPILGDVYGAEQAALWHQRWRIFFMACSELFGFRGGQEWWVTHVRMAPGGATA